MSMRAEPGLRVTRVPDVMSFRVLGRVEAVDGRGRAVPLGPPRSRALLAALLVHPGVALSVDRLTDLLWDCPAPATARTMVHGAVAALRRAFAECSPEGERASGLLITRPDGYLLEIATAQLDAARFEELLAEGRRLSATRPERAAELLTEALELWRGPALAGIENAFAREAANRWEELRLECVEARMAAELDAGHHRQVVAELGELVTRHPFREELCALLAMALYRCGRQADALVALRAARQRLAEELGLLPGPALRTLQEAILRHSPDLQLVAPASSPARFGRPLPAAFSSFVGRIRERSELAELVLAHRLVSVTGPGGAGKSRLAREVSVDLAERGAAEVVFADLAPLATPELVGEAIAQALGVRPASGQVLHDAVRTAVAGRTVLLLLDNCEHLAPACAVALIPMLSAVRGLHALLTTRVALRVSGEYVYPVGSLPVAAPEDGWERIAACDAVRLFVERVAAARPGFAASEQNARTVLEICQRLDGLPLALELVAARAPSLPLPDLLHRLDQSFHLLDVGAHQVDDVRHRSLTATIAWSHDLLTESERQLFARISVFPSSFSLAAAEDVASGDGLLRRDIAVLMSGLVASSTVELVDGRDGEPRYRSLETTRQYSRGLLDDPALGVLRRRHAEHYLHVAEAARPHLFRPGSAAWLHGLEIESDHFRGALEWAFGSDGDPALGARLIGCLWHLWDLRGARREGLHWVDAGLRALSPGAADERLRLLAAGALFHLGRAEFAAVAALAGEQRVLAHAVGNQPSEGDALALGATVAWARGTFDQAQHLYEDGIALSLAGGDTWGASLAEAQLARLHRDRDEPDAATSVVLRARRHAEEVGEDLARGLSADVLASIEHRWGDLGAAGELVEEALQRYRAVGYLEGEASALHLRGQVALSSGASRRARADFEGSLRLCRRIGLPGGAAAALEGLAGAAAADFDHPRAVRLFAAATTLREKIDLPLTDRSGRAAVRPWEQLIADIDPEVTTLALQRARALSLEELMEADGGDDD